LFCAGADIPESDTLGLGGKWISTTTAQVGLLHVVPVNKPGTSKDSNNQKQSADFIELCSQKLREAGVKNQIMSHIRRGAVVDEVLTELSEENYDLLVIGSHYQPGKDLWRGTLFDDVTDQLINRANCSVLII
jgi:nucleotide-binding universal stress UspA family protein